VPEQLRLEQRLGNGRAVDRDERPVGAVAVRMQRTGEQLLAGPALAAEQHRGLGRRHATQALQYVEQHGVLADDRRGAMPRAQRLLEEQVLGDQPSLLDGAADHEQEVLVVDRLGQVVERALAHGGDGFLDGAIAGHEDHREGGVEFLGRAQHPEAIARGQAEIGQDQRGAVESERIDGGRLVGGLDDAVALPRQDGGEHVPQVVVVVDEQDVWRVARCG
jgi:hypothetical protein